MIDLIDESMIEDSITIHDKFQFEIKWAHKFIKEMKSSTYNIETYFFIPQSLGINKVSYTRNDFYNDLKTYIRFKTPSILLQNIADGSNSIIDALCKAFKMATAQPDSWNLSEYENKIKLFCCEFKSSVREHVEYIANSDIDNDIDFLLNQYIKCTEQISNAYRELRKVLHVPCISKKQFSKYLFGDEYISLVIEDYTYNLLNILDKKGSRRINGSYSDKLLQIIKNENAYRKNNEYPSIASMDGENEVFVFRKSILKKYMGNILFLDIRTIDDGKFLEHIAFGTAAALSMLFATVVAFLIQKSYGNLSFPLFAALVISYIFKDRIKEILRVYLSSKLCKVLYNYKTYLRTRTQEEVGWCKEHFSFKNESELPEEILKLRNKDHITEIENESLGEQVILYKKLIRLYTGDLENISRIGPIDGINDILRFNVQKFLVKMDNPLKPIFVLYENGYRKIMAKRLYHLNLIIKYSCEDKAIFKRFRIILNRNGIKSIELV